MAEHAETIAAIDRFFDAIGAEDLDAAMRVVEEIVHPEVEFNSVIADAFEGRAYKGRAGVQSWIDDLVSTFDIEYRNRQHRQVDASTILSLTDMQLRGRGSGADVSREIGMVIELDDGLIRRLRSYGTHAEAIAAAEARA